MVSQKSVLITGAPRSGTTWVGRTLAQAARTRYVHEPFNLSAGPCACGVKIDKWFYYVTKETDAACSRHFHHLLKPGFHLWNTLNFIADLKQKKKLQRMFRYIKSFRNDRSIVKDPLAIFSAEWLESTFDMDVVVLVRHPAAVVSSYKKLNWSHDFTHFVSQDALMQEHLHPFKDEINRLVDRKADDIDRISVLWKIINYAAIKLTIKHENWICVRYEDIVQSPVAGFESIFKRLDLGFSGNVENFIRERSFVSDSIEDKNPYSIVRDSQQVARSWKKNLSLRQIERIKQHVEGVSAAFYSEDSWT